MTKLSYEDLEKELAKAQRHAADVLAHNATLRDEIEKLERQDDDNWDGYEESAGSRIANLIHEVDRKRLKIRELEAELVELKATDVGLLLSQIDVTAQLLRDRNLWRSRFEKAYEAHRRKDHLINDFRREEEALVEELRISRMDMLELLDQFRYALRQFLHYQELHRRSENTASDLASELQDARDTIRYLRQELEDH